MVFKLIVFYYWVACIALIAAFLGYLRGTYRSLARLASLGVFAAVSAPLASLLSYPFSGLVLRRILKKAGESTTTVISANPDLVLTLRSVIAAVLVPILTAVFFAFFWLVSLAFFDKLTATPIGKVANKLPKAPQGLAKASGVCIGAISGLLILSVLLTPVYFTASVLENTPTESLEAIDGEFLSKDGKDGKQRSDVRLKTLKNGISVFSRFSEEYDIQGFDKPAQVELANLLATAGDGFTAYKVILDSSYGIKLNAYLGAASAVGANTEHSALLTSLIKGTARAVGNLEAQTLSEMLSAIPGSDIIGSVLPSIFSAIADTPDEDIPTTFETFFGAPPIELARAKELREKAELEASATEIEIVATEPSTEPPYEIPEETEPPEETEKPTVTEAPVAETESLESPATEEFFEAMESLEAPQAPETTKTPETTKAPSQQTEHAVGGSTGLIGALIGGGGLAGNANGLTQNKLLFDSIKSAAFAAMSSKLDVTSEDYACMYVLLRDELEKVLVASKNDPNMTQDQKVDLFASSVSASLGEIFTPEEFGEYGMELLLNPSTMQLIAVFALDSFTLEKYPDGNVPLEDVMLFMGIAKSEIPEWIKNYE